MHLAYADRVAPQPNIRSDTTASYHTSTGSSGIVGAVSGVERYIGEWLKRGSKW